MMKAKFLFLFVALFVSVAIQQVSAVPAIPWPVEKTQPDGTKITVYLRGDEKVHWMESLDGYTLMYDSEKYVVYAEQDQEGNMVPSKVRFGYPSLRSSTSDIQKGLRYSESQLSAFRQIWTVAENSGSQKAPAAVLGQKKALCILVEFPDKPFIKTNTEFSNLLNQIGYSASSAVGSVKDFYLENSYNQMELTTTAVGPVKMAGNYQTYLSGTAPGHRYVTSAFITEVIDRAVDVGVNLQDYAVDNILETFHIIFAGYGDETIGNGQQIWSHKSAISTYLKDGVYVSTYSCSPELYTGTQITNIGVICHELGHVFGAPDYYDTNGSTGGDFGGAGLWDLMANGSWNGSGRSPAHINMFQKILYGWVNPTELTSYTEITNMPTSASGAVAYTFKANADGEMYVLENRQQTGFDSYVPGHGLLIWHVHKNALAGRGSNTTHPQQLYPVVASSTVAIPNSDPASYGSINSAGTPFSGNMAFTDNTTPQAFTWDGLQGIAKPLTNIVESSNKISFTFMQSAGDPVANLDATITDGSTVTLSWTAPVSGNITAYKIFRDNILQYTISNKNTTAYTQMNVPNGAYNYCVTAIYDELLESEKACISVEITGGSTTTCFPVTDLTASARPDKVTLNWNPPFSGGWSTIASNLTGASGYSLSSFIVAVLWTPDDLNGMNGFKLNKVKFAAYENGTTYAANYTVVVYSRREGENPILEYSQPISHATLNTNFAYNEITLNNPVEIDTSKEWIIGIRFERTGTYSGYVLDGSDDANPRNLYSTNGSTWTTLSLGRGINRNFCFEAYFNKESSNEYRIYKNSQLIASTTNTTYADETVASSATYTYCVSAYSDDCLSEPLCIEATTGVQINPNPVKDLQLAKSGDDDVLVTWSKPDTHSSKTLAYYSTIDYVSGYATDYSYAIRFTPDDLKTIPGFKLSRITYSVHHGTVTTETVDFTLCVWKGRSGELIYEQVIPSIASNFSNGDHAITLTNPVEIDVYEDLWFGVRVHPKTSSTPLAISYNSSQSNVEGKGGMIYINGTWTNFAYIIKLSGYVEPISELTSYEIARNGADITTISNPNTLTFSDNNPGNGLHEYCVTAVYSSLKSDPVCADILIGPSTWTGIANNDWNNPANWNSGSIPTEFSSVIIPGGLSRYPVLTSTTEAKVKEIRFAPGAEIGNQHYLPDAYKAYVQLDFGASTSSLTRERWYMLANPLQELYAGDFSFGGYPGMDMKLFQSAGNKTVWNRISATTHSFSLGDGFILWLAPDPEAQGEKGLIKSGGILELPYFDNPNVDPIVHWTHHYEAFASIFGGWTTNGSGSIVEGAPSEPVSRDPNKAYRLAGQTVNKILDFGEDHFAIAGNPYMSSIDFPALYEANKTLIKGTYQIWIGPGGTLGGSYAGYNVPGNAPFGRNDAPVDMSRYIAPMQSFIVEKLDASAPTTLAFDLAAIGATGHNPGLRSADSQGDKLDIVASTAQVGVRTVIVSRQEGGDSFGSADSRKLFDEINNLPEVYTLKPEANKDQVATAVNVLDEITGETLVPLAIATTYKGELTFTFSGMDTYNARIFLLDTETNTEIELTDKAQYEYKFNYVPEQSGGKIVSNESRFFIRLHKVATGIADVASEVVRIYASRSGTLQVVSTHPLHQVLVYNLQGTRIYNAQVQTNTHKVEGLVGGVYIVKVISNNTVKTEKVIVRN